MSIKFRSLRGLTAEERGSLSVEAAMVVPLLIWGIVAMFTFFHAYKAQNAAFRANYTISDILSRETEEIDFSYLRGMQNLYQYMTFSQTADTWIRVSVIQCTDNCEEDDRTLKIDWSMGTNGARSLTDVDFDLWEPMTPWLPKGDSLILVETSSQYNPLFPKFLVTFQKRALVSHSVTRPRFSGQLVYAGLNDGDDDIAQEDDNQNDQGYGAGGWFGGHHRGGGWHSH